MWNEILRTNQKKGNSQDKYLIILGDPNSGKRTVFNTIIELLNKQGKEINSSKEDLLKLEFKNTAIDYFYLDGVDLEEPSEDSNSKINCYIIESPMFFGLAKTIIKNAKLENVIILIMLDWKNVNFVVNLQA